jgi:hypothetical protein
VSNLCPCPPPTFLTHSLRIRPALLPSHRSVLLHCTTARRTSNVVWLAGISAEPENYFDTMATLRLGQRLRETHRATTASVGLSAKFFVAWRNVLSARLRAMDEPTNWQSLGPGSASGLGSIAMIAEALRRPQFDSSYRR